jgi:uroporphyrinogen-III synthase
VSARPLAGKRIVVTRPREQAEGLAARIREAGGEPLFIPAIEIRDLADLGPFHVIADRLEEFDCAIFVSPTAVRKALRLLRARRGSRPWPVALRVAAIGRGSQRALQDEGVPGALAPMGQADSEALLEMPAFASPAGWRIVIFRGRGGRELLGETLAARGARVEYAECYVRAKPEARSGPIGGMEFPGAAVDAVTVTSGEGLVNLHEMLDERSREQLRQIPLFVPHARVAEQAAGLGVRKVSVCGPGDAEMMSALVAYFRSAK